MTQTKRYILPFLLTLVAVLFSACTESQKEPAEAALAAVDTQVGAIDRDEVEKYLPDSLIDIDRALASLKSNFSKGDYPSVIAGAPDLTNQVAALSERLIQAKQAAEAQEKLMAAQWNTVKSKLAGMLSSIESSLMNPPKGVTPAEIESAGTRTAELKRDLLLATTEYDEGQLAAALAKIQTIETEASVVMNSLGFAE